MYNRYTQKPDGSYERSRMTDPVIPQQRPQAPPQQRPQAPPSPPPVHHEPPIPLQSNSPFSFLKQLLPKGFDLGDLAIVFLLLLMAGDSEDNRSNALLTIALYFIM